MNVANAFRGLTVGLMNRVMHNPARPKELLPRPSRLFRVRIGIRFDKIKLFRVFSVALMTSLDKPSHQDGAWTAPEPISILPRSDFQLAIINILTTN